jgi:hypothetical protein
VSDLDFAVVLRHPEVTVAEEIFETSPICTQLELKYGLMLSSLIVSEQKKNNSMQWLTRRFTFLLAKTRTNTIKF